MEKAVDSPDAHDEPKKLKVLSVCTSNRHRSLTAEELYRNNSRLEVQSAGVHKLARVQLTAEHLEWADVVFVFEKRQRNIIHKRFKELYARKRIICLYVPDVYDFMDEELIDILCQRLSRYIGLPEESA